MIRNVVDRLWESGEGLVPVVLPPYPSQYCLPEQRDILTNLNTSSDSSNRSGNHACISFLAMVKFVHESEALNVVSGAGDTILIGKPYKRSITIYI